VISRNLLNFVFISVILVFTSTAEAGYKGRLVPGDWMEHWNQTLNESLDASTLFTHRESQIERLCPGYNRDDGKRRIFWNQLMISLSWKESLHGPENYVHFNGGTNDGLYQINPVLRTAYGCKDFDLFDPLQNMQCAVKMAQKLVNRFGSFLKGTKGGMAAYWQPLRGTSKYNRKNREWILSFVKSACKSGNIAYHSPSSMGLIEVDRTFNTLEDLGLEPGEIEPSLPGLQWF